MPFGKVEVQGQQLWKKIRKLRDEKADLEGTIIALEAKIEAMSDYEDLKKEVETLRHDIANLKRSNTMLRKHQTS